MDLRNLIKIFFIFFLLFNCNTAYSQYSKNHYIPPITSTGSGGGDAQEQYLYISTPSQTPVSVTIKPLGGTEITQLVSNAAPWEYFIGDGNNTNLILRSNLLDGDPFDDKGFIVEAEYPVYVSARLFSSGQSYQAGTIVSKGTTALGNEFRAGTFVSGGFLEGSADNYLDFISVLATQDNTTVNFSEFGNGVTFVNNIPTSNIILNAGESYSVATRPYPSSTNFNNAGGLIGALIESDKPIAVNSGSYTGSNSLIGSDTGQDIGIDQLVPSDVVGDEYIFVRGLGPDEVERPLIVAHEDNTEVYVNGTLQTTLNASEYYSIPSTFYGVSYEIDDYDFGGNVNNDGYPEVNPLTGLVINPAANADDQPATNQSSNMYVNTSKPVFAYQVVGGLRTGSGSSWGGVTNGVANVGLFFVPPINCTTPNTVNNIPAVSNIGPVTASNGYFGGVVTIIAESGADLFINGNPVTDYGAVAQTVTANPLFESYTIENLLGDITVESNAQVYVATFGAEDFATFGGYYSGFDTQPEIVLEPITIGTETCIPNINLSLGSISTYDEYQWFYNGVEIPGATQPDFVPTEAGYYQISANILNCAGEALSNNLPVSSCPEDYDNDGINDNIDVDIDNDGILNCVESLGNQFIDLSNPAGGNINGIYDYTFGLNSSDSTTAEWIGDNLGNWQTSSPPYYFDSDSNPQDGFISSSTSFNNEISLAISHSGVINSTTVTSSLDNEEWFSIKVPFDKTLTLLDPDDQVLIDSNFDGIFETGITNFSNFEIRFRINGASLDAQDANFIFYTHLTDYFEVTHYNSSQNVNTAIFNVIATCLPLDSDGDGVVDSRDFDSDNDGITDIVEASGDGYIPISGIDTNGDGYDDIFANDFTPNDFDNDGVYDYLDLDSDNDGIFDLHESGALTLVNDGDLNGVIDGTVVGNNGLNDSIETTADSGILNYSVENTTFNDDDFFNYINLDSDSDGCYDVVEAGYTDQNDDGILGDNPISTDPVTGLITSGIDGYTLPINDDYIIGAPIVIDVQPEIEYIVCENGSVQITIQSSTIDEYQWQSSPDGINWS